MIFENDPFELLNKAFRNLYPEKEYKACFLQDIRDSHGEIAHGFTQFDDSGIPKIAISAELTIIDAVEIFAHELAHVADGGKSVHGEKWEQEFEKLYQEYNRLGNEMFR